MTELPEPVQSTFALFETRRGNFLLALFIALEWYLFLVFGGMYMATTLQDKAVCAALGHVYKKANCIPERSV